MATDHMTMFDKLNLAQCARLRATTHLMDGDRFHREYQTAHLWMHYKVVSLPGYRYVERY
jgi:hypothetical protein